MREAIVSDAGAPASLAPLTCTRSLADLPVANRRFGDVLSDRLRAAGFRVSTVGDTQAMVSVAGDAWLSDALLAGLAVALPGTVFTDESGYVLARVGTGDLPPERADAGSFRLARPWDLLRVNEILVGALEEDSISGDVSPGVHVEGRLVLGPGSRLLPGVFIEGNAVIGSNCKIGPNCYIRGNTSIGDGCHIGNAVEVKNSILMRGAAIGHLSYCGDSVIGEKTNFGAGTITANFRHDGKTHRSFVGAELVDTGRRKLGAVIGDDVHTGVHTAIYPGRKIWPHMSTLPGDVVRRDIRPES